LTETESHHSAGLTYRPDIDGLRAISVLLVILFHAEVPGFTGGYVGVDVFFVISGYLITLLLIAPSDQTLARRLTNFYLRRGRRILPALLVLLIVSTVAAAVLFLPSDLRRFGRSLGFAAGLMGNVGTWYEGDYFYLGDNFAPLQHLWSIGVEEQFYLVYPVLLLLVSRFLPARSRWIMAGLAISSLSLCIWISYYSPVANYYMPPTRAWQLFLGALVALGAVREIKNRIVNDLLAVVSLGAILLVAHFYERSTRYPGVYAIVPSVAATALIAAGVRRSTYVGRLLSMRPFVFTGLISYSLYLWHFPTLSFFTYYNIDPPSVVELVGLLIMTYVIAVASWAAVEKPVREGIFLRSNRSLGFAASITTVVLGLSGCVFWLSLGLPERFEAEIQRLTAGTDRFHFAEPKCLAIPVEKIAEGDLCSYGPTGKGLKKAVVWGDSHALALLPAYEALAHAHRIRLYFGIVGACRPLMVAAGREESDYWSVRCANFNSAMARAIRRLDPDLIILNAYWLNPETGSRADSVEVVPGKSRFAWGLEETLRQVGSRNRSVCAVLTVPSYKHPVPYALAMAYRRHVDAESLVLSRTEALEQYRDAERELRLAEQRGLLRIADPKDVLCRTDKCVLRSADGSPLYRDRTHLSLAGARFVSSVLSTCLQDIG